VLQLPKGDLKMGMLIVVVAVFFFMAALSNIKTEHKE
jgi:hypothetical protein